MQDELRKFRIFKVLGSGVSVWDANERFGEIALGYWRGGGKKEAKNPVFEVPSIGSGSFGIGKGTGVVVGYVPLWSALARR